MPESLTHQWFVELLRRFNLWFSIYDEERCLALRAKRSGQESLSRHATRARAACPFSRATRARREQAVAAGWDMVVVDEAHHLAWTPEHVSPEYALVEELARRVSRPAVAHRDADAAGTGRTFRAAAAARSGSLQRFRPVSRRSRAVSAPSRKSPEKLSSEKPLKPDGPREPEKDFQPGSRTARASISTRWPPESRARARR